MKAICIIMSVFTAALSALFIFAGVTQKNNAVPNLNLSETLYSVSGEVNYDSLESSLCDIETSKMKSTQYPQGILPSLKKAYSINNALVGWLTIPGTEMDTAVVQGSDNSRYLTRDFYERLTYETSGTNYGNLFLDYQCDGKGNLSKNMIIHGHTTGKSDGIPKQSFRSLYDFRDKNYFIENPLIKYSTLYSEYTYKICAVFLSSTVPSDDNGYFFNYIYPDMTEERMTGYIEQVKQRALYETGVSLEAGDKVLALSTCIYDYGKNVDTRLVVLGRLLHEGETEDIDASLVKDNENYRRPQVWYSSRGLTNPYANAEKWQPVKE